MRRVTLSIALAWAYLFLWTLKFGMLPPLDIFHTLSIGALMWLNLGSHRPTNALVISCVPFILLPLSIDKVLTGITILFITISSLLYYVVGEKMGRLGNILKLKFKIRRFLKSKNWIFYCRETLFSNTRYHSTCLETNVGEDDAAILYKGTDFVLLNKDYTESIKPKENWIIMEGEKIFKLMKAGARTKEDIVLESI